MSVVVGYESVAELFVVVLFRQVVLDASVIREVFYKKAQFGAAANSSLRVDEFERVGQFKNVGEMLDYYSSKFHHLGVFAIRWKHLFPKDFPASRPGDG